VCVLFSAKRKNCAPTPTRHIRNTKKYLEIINLQYKYLYQLSCSSNNAERRRK
jgi:hypothetical protein